MNVASDVAFDRFLESLELGLEAVRRQQKSETTGECALWQHYESEAFGAANWNANSLLFRYGVKDSKAAQLQTLAPLVRLI